MLNVSEAPTPLKNTSHGRLHLSNTRVRGAYTSQTRKHSSRMRTARLETVHAPILLATTRCLFMGEVGEGPQMNKFEQVSSDHHQLSLTGGRVVGVPARMSGGGGRVGSQVWCRGGGESGGPRSDDCGGGGEFCLVTSNAWWVMDRCDHLPVDRMTDGQTRLKILPSLTGGNKCIPR